MDEGEKYKLIEKYTIFLWQIPNICIFK